MTVETRNPSIDIPIANQTLYENLPRVTISYFIWLTLFFVTGWISRLLIPRFTEVLTSKEQMFWNLAAVRAICGMLTPVAAYITFYDDRISRDYVMATTDESWTFFVFLTGFFIFEELTLIYFDVKYKTFSKELHLHHFFAFNGFFFSILYNRGHYYGAKAFLLEASTPFSCICWCLLKFRLEKTFIWKANQWILIYIFHMRTVFELWWWYDIYKDWANVRDNLPLPYTINMFLGLSIVTFWLTPYWTYRKTAQFFHPVDWNSEQDSRKKKK